MPLFSHYVVQCSHLYYVPYFTVSNKMTIALLDFRKSNSLQGRSI